MKAFKTTDLPEHLDDLLQAAAAGQLSLVTRDGEPVFMAVPFTVDLLHEDVAVSLAVKLFDEDIIALREGARMAHLSLSEFINSCGGRGVSVVRYSPSELEMELANIRRVTDGGQ